MLSVFLISVAVGTSMVLGCCRLKQELWAGGWGGMVGAGGRGAVCLQVRTRACSCGGRGDYTHTHTHRSSPPASTLCLTWAPSVTELIFQLLHFNGRFVLWNWTIGPNLQRVFEQQQLFGPVHHETVPHAFSRFLFFSFFVLWPCVVCGWYNVRVMEIQLFGLKLDFLRFYLCGHSSSVFLGVTSGVTRADHVPFHFILSCRHGWNGRRDSCPDSSWTFFCAGTFLDNDYQTPMFARCQGTEGTQISLLTSSGCFG